VVQDPEIYPTIIDGEDTRRVVYLTGPATIILEGLTIANGKIISTTATSWNGAGLYAQNVDLTLRQTNVYSNAVDVFDADNSWGYGGGMYVEGGTLQVEASTFMGNSTWTRKQNYGGGLAISGTFTATVTGTTFLNNDAWQAGGLHFLGKGLTDDSLLLRDNIFVGNGKGKSRGRAFSGYTGAIKVEYARAEIENNLFHDSRASNSRGAVSVYYSDLSFTRNLITDNNCSETSGLHLRGVSPFTVTNNIIANNQGDPTHNGNTTSAIHVEEGNGIFAHNTIAYNKSEGGQPYGIKVRSGAVVTLTNTLLLSHTVGITVANDGSVALYNTLFYAHDLNNTEGKGTIINTHPITGQDPLLTTDYHLWPNSPAINAGVNAGVILDIDGDVRPHDGGYDIGADEFTGVVVYLPLVVRANP
jgi:hypothetical protein